MASMTFHCTDRYKSSARCRMSFRNIEYNNALIMCCMKRIGLLCTSISKSLCVRGKLCSIYAIKSCTRLCMSVLIWEIGLLKLSNNTLSEMFQTIRLDYRITVPEE